MKLRFLLFLFLLCFAFPAAAATVSAGVPLDSWIYPAIDKLAGLGLIDSALQGSRPFSRLEAARLTREAQAHAAAGAPLTVTNELLQRLNHELRREIEEVGGNPAGSYLQPLRQLDFDYFYQDGIPSVIVGAGVDARQDALNTNNFGTTYNQGSSAQLLIESEARLGNSLLLSLRPQLLLREEEESDPRLRLREGKVALGLGPIEVSAGRQSLWWGQGQHGSLLLTNNAVPLDMVRITNPTPVVLPWVFGYLGPLRFDFFLSQLDDYVANSATGHGNEPYFAGLRLNFKPLPYFEIGAARTTIFGGDGIDVSNGDYFTILSGRNLSGEEETSNQVAAIDVRIKIPALAGAELYGEYGGEDEAGNFIAHRAWIAGLYLPRLEPSGRMALRLEYADLTDESKLAPAWYRHGTFHSGYTWQGKVLGHHVGGAARDLFGELQLQLPGDVKLTAGVDAEERGTDQPVAEKHLQPFIDLEWALQQGWLLGASYALDQVKNAGYQSGVERTDHFARFSLSKSW